MSRHASLALAVSLATSVTLATSCSTPRVVRVDLEPDEREAVVETPFSKGIVAWRLVLVHLSDSEAGLLPHDATPEVGGIARAQAVVAALKDRGGPDAVVVGVGDLFIPSPELDLEIDGRSAVLAGNDKLGLVASALGNHELDRGEEFLAGFVASMGFPYLSATLTVKGGPLAKVFVDVPTGAGATTPWAHELKGKLAPRAKVCTAEIDASGVCRGLSVGLVGVTTEELRLISAGASKNLAMPDDLAGVRAAVQKQVDALRDEGVKVVVLLSHLQGAARERALVEGGLTGVDVVLAGGGENRLASKKHRLLEGDKPDRLCAPAPAGWGEPCYPTTLVDREGKPVLLASTGGSLEYVGNLVTSYDDAGVLTGFHLTGSRPWPVDEETLLELRASVDKDTLAFQQHAKKELVPLLAELARTDVFLEGTREEVRNRETNLGDLSADAIAFAARTATSSPLFALRNGGGIRGSIGGYDEHGNKTGGPIRVMDLKTVLRFDSKIVVVETTHAELKATLESALRGAGTSKGHFPQVSAEVKLEYTTNAPEQTHVLQEGRIASLACPGARVQNLVVTPAGAAPIVVVKDGVMPTPDAKITWATIDYLAQGGDGWFPAQNPKVTRVEGATEQSSIRAYIDDQVKKGRWSSGRGYVDGEGKRIVASEAKPASVPAGCAP